MEADEELKEEMSFEDPSFREEDSFKMAGDFNRMEQSMGRHMI